MSAPTSPLPAVIAYAERARLERRRRFDAVVRRILAQQEVNQAISPKRA